MKKKDKPLLSLEGVGKTFQTDKIQTNALSDINLSIYEGEFVAIAGPSGCGKSTLLSIRGLLDTPTSGRYFINEQPMEKLDHAALARVRNAEIGFVFQDFNLIGDMTVFENVELPLTHRPAMSRAERKARVMECLAVVGMTDRAEHFPAQLSGGQQQRVAVARSVVGRPSVLLADEPTGNLDSANGDAVMKLLSELNTKQKVTICMVTHDSRYMGAASRAIRLFDGKIVADDVQVAAA